jgi:voltage-gated potassium channel
MSETSVTNPSPLDRWTRATDWPLMAAAVLFLVGYALPIIDLDLVGWLRTSCRLVVWITWALLAVDYVVRVVLAERRLRYVVRHWLDLLIIALPLLRPLRLLRFFALLSFLNRRASTRLRGRVAIYVSGGATLLIFCAALAVLDAERSNPNANIRSFGEAVWWAVTTMTTVGYGDHYPTTVTGKVVAVALMIGAVTVLGSVTATFASWLVEHVSEAERAETESLEDQIADLRRLVVELHTQLVVQTADSGTGSPGVPDGPDRLPG